MGLALRQLFARSQNEIWERLSREVAGDFTRGDGITRSAKVEVHVGEWTVTLDSTGGKLPMTRMRAPYVNKDGLRFKVFRRGLLTAIDELLGLEDLEIGDPELDRDFVFQANHRHKLVTLFAHPRLRELLKAQPSIHLEVRDDEGWFGATFPDGVDELRFLAGGIITDVARLKQLYDLFAEVLHQLCRIGSAYEDDPGVTLR